MNNPLTEYTEQLRIKAKLQIEAAKKTMAKAEKIYEINREKLKNKKDLSITIIRANGSVEKIRNKEGVLIR